MSLDHGTATRHQRFDRRGLDQEGPRVSVSSLDGTALMSIVGEVDLASVHVLSEAFGTIDLREGLIIDVSGVTFINSTGLSFLVAANKEVMSQGSHVVLLSPTPWLRKLFDVCGLTRYFVIESERSKIV